MDRMPQKMQFTDAKEIFHQNGLKRILQPGTWLLATAYVKRDFRSKRAYRRLSMRYRSDILRGYRGIVLGTCKQGYRDGLVGPSPDYAMRKYSGHRAIPQDQLDVVKRNTNSISLENDSVLHNFWVSFLFSFTCLFHTPISLKLCLYIAYCLPIRHHQIYSLISYNSVRIRLKI